MVEQPVCHPSDHSTLLPADADVPAPRAAAQSLHQSEHANH